MTIRIFLPTLDITEIFSTNNDDLTCGLEHGHGHGLHVVADRGHGDGVVPSRLELGQGEDGVLHQDTAAVSASIEGLFFSFLETLF